jgi:hypothetical protein
MKHIIALVALSLVGGCAAASAEDQAMARADGEATLAAELRDHRPSGPPVSCVPLRNLQGNRSAGEGAIIFAGQSGRLWVNRPPAGCPVIDSGRAISLRTTGTQLCRGEIVNVFDPVNGFNYGSCGLGDFEPYERRRDN